MITLTLKEDAQEFLDESKLKEVVTKYSEFIVSRLHYPGQRHTRCHSASKGGCRASL